MLLWLIVSGEMSGLVTAAAGALGVVLAPDRLTGATPRRLSRELIDQLRTSERVRHGQNCLITGATGIGRSWLACALGRKACRDGHQALYLYSPKFSRELLAANADGSLTKMVRRLGRLDLLVVDDWGMEMGRRAQYRDFLELVDGRHGGTATLITSRYPPEDWHDIVGNPTVGDAIVDRLTHGAYRIDLVGKSRRGNDPPNPLGKPEGEPAKPGAQHRAEAKRTARRAWTAESRNGAIDRWRETRRCAPGTQHKEPWGNTPMLDTVTCAIVRMSVRSGRCPVSHEQLSNGVGICSLAMTSRAWRSKSRPGTRQDSRFSTIGN